MLTPFPTAPAVLCRSQSSATARLPFPGEAKGPTAPIGPGHAAINGELIQPGNTHSPTPLPGLPDSAPTV